MKNLLVFYFLLLGLAAQAATVKFSELPSTNNLIPSSIVAVSADTGSGFSSRQITVSNLAMSLMSAPSGTWHFTNTGASFRVLSNGTAIMTWAGGGVTVAGDPTSALGVATKQYVDAATNGLSMVNFVTKINSSPFTNSAPVTLTAGLTNTGATLLSGTVTLGGDPSSGLQAATKQYVDASMTAGAGFTNGSVLYVQTNGYALGTAVRGNPNFPFNTITAAVSQAQSGDTIKLGAGTHYVLNTRVTLPNNVSLIGEGMHATHIVGNSRLQTANQGPTVTPGNNSLIARLSLSNTNLAEFAAPLGVYHGISAQSFTNVVVEGVKLIGYSDALYCYSSNFTTITLIGCEVQSAWDAVYTFGHSNSLIRLSGCYLLSTNTGVPAASAETRNAQVTVGRLQVDNCRLEAYGGSSYAVGLYVGGEARVWVNNSSFNGGLSPSYWAVTNLGGFVFMDGTDIGPGEVVGAGTTTFSPTTVSSLLVSNPLGGWADIFGKPMPLGSGGSTNITLTYPRRFHTLTTNETISIDSSTNTHWGVSITYYSDNAGPDRLISWNTNAWRANSGGGSPITVASNGWVKVVLESITNRIHIDWTGTNAGGGGSGDVTMANLIATNNAIINTLTLAASNSVRVTAGSGVTVTPSQGSGIYTYQVAANPGGLSNAHNNNWGNFLEWNGSAWAVRPLAGGWIIDEEFIGHNANEGFVGREAWHVVYGGGGYPLGTYDLKDPGVVQYQGTNLNAYAYTTIGGGSATIVLTNGTYFFLCRVKIDLTNTATADVAEYRIGLDTSSAAGYGCYFENLTNVWRLVTGNSAAWTHSTTGTNVVPGQWTYLGWYCPSPPTNVIAFVGTSTTNLLPFATNSANLPSDGVSATSPMISFAQTAGTGVTMGMKLGSYRLWYRPDAP